MNVVFSHPDALLAQAARDHLLAHGILAAVVSRTEGWMASVRSHDVMLCFSKQREEARAVLADESWLPERADEGWEAGESLPDLSRLDPGLAPACPSCERTLPLNAALERCPSCSEGVDVAELIAQAHGPEALDPCYAEGEPAIDPAVMRTLVILCPRCDYGLGGLPDRGVCPECGVQYDKEWIVREFLSS